MNDIPITVSSLLEALPDALLVVDAAGAVCLANLQAEWLFGRPRDEMLGQSLELLLPERFRGIHAQHRRGYNVAPRVRPMGANLLLYAQQKDGTEIPVQISLGPLMTSGGLFVVAIVRRRPTDG